MDKRLLRETRLTRLPFMATVGLSFLGGLFVIGQAYLLSQIISRAFLDEATRSDLQSLFIGFIVTILLRMFNQALLSVSAAETAIGIKQNLRERLIDHLLQLGPAYTQRERSGELALTATEGIEQLDSFFRDYLPALFTSLLIPLAILFVVLPVDGLTFSVLLITAPLIPIFMVLIGMSAGALARNRYGQLGQLSAHFLDVMQGLRTLKLFNRSKPQIDIISKMTDRYRRGTMAVLRVAFLSALVLELLATISVAVVAVEIGLRLLYGRLSFESALFLLILAPEFYMPLRQLGAKFHAGRDGTAAAERIYNVLNTPVPAESTADLDIPNWTHIAFRGVSVDFPTGGEADEKRVALSRFDFELPKGQHIAIVGRSGSGKSTVANLLMRFLDPTSGTISLIGRDGEIDLAAIPREKWRQTIGWVPQRGHLFDLSIRDNIDLGRAVGFTGAAKAAQIDRFIKTLPGQYEAHTGEQGSRISGGQAQRIAIARALASRPPIYLFDEATANLDSKNEAEVLAHIETIVRETGATVITIAHRLHTITAADQIVVLDQGDVVEVGPYLELIDRRGAFFELLQLEERGQFSSAAMAYEGKSG